MKLNLQFDFQVDQKKNTITITREFGGERQLVWDCYTKSELLDQWFAPSPLTTKTKTMDFTEGGHWLYAMVEPKGTEYWGRMDYLAINPINSYTCLDGFTDSSGVLNPELPRATWDVTFTDHLATNVIVQTVVTYNSLTDLEAVIQMGMKDGLVSTMEKLDSLLLKLKK